MTSPLVSAEWLKANITAPELRIVDATWFPGWIAGPGAGRAAYEREHIPGAVHFDIDDICDSDSALPHMLPDALKFSSRVRKLGIGDGSHIVVYDANNFFASARVWWMFRAMSHRNVYVLDGGLSAWKDVGGGLVSSLPEAGRGRHFTASMQPKLVKTKEQVHKALERGSPPVLDARPAGRFNGTDPEPREGLPSGHMPGSINVPGSALLGADGRLISDDELAEMLGPYTHSSVIASCGSGVSAAIIALALAQLGNWDVALYDGSWTDWASDEGTPIETEAA